MVQGFYNSEKLPWAINSFIAMILKKSNPQSMLEYRPISLIGSIHQLISKVLASRLKKVLPQVISMSQTAFLLGRNILDGVVMLNELVNFASRYGKSCFMFKIEFEKVYNFIKWGFLDYTLGRLGFDLIWQGQIKSVVCSSYLSMLVNGSLTKEFEAQRGLKQGDPLAPFLFIIVVEA